MPGEIFPVSAQHRRGVRDAGRAACRAAAGGPFLYPPDEESDQSLETCGSPSSSASRSCCAPARSCRTRSRCEVDELEERDDGLLVRPRPRVGRDGVAEGHPGRRRRAHGPGGRHRRAQGDRAARSAGACTSTCACACARAGAATRPCWTGWASSDRAHPPVLPPCGGGRVRRGRVRPRMARPCSRRACRWSGRSTPSAWRIRARSPQQLAAEADAAGRLRRIASSSCTTSRGRPARARVRGHGLERLPRADHAAAAAARARPLQPGAGGEVSRETGRRGAGRVPARAAVRLAGRGGAPARGDGRPLRPRAERPRLRRAARGPGVRLPAVHRTTASARSTRSAPCSAAAAAGTPARRCCRRRRGRRRPAATRLHAHRRGRLAAAPLQEPRIQPDRRSSTSS